MEPLKDQAEYYVKHNTPPSMHGVAYMVYCEAYVKGLQKSKIKTLFWFCLGVAVGVVITLIIK